MTTVSIVAESRRRLADLCAALSGEFSADYLRLEDLPHRKPNDTVIVDFDFGQCSGVQAVKTWLSNRPQSGTVILCVDDASSHLQLTQARAIGATAVVQRPLNATRLRDTLRGLDQSLTSSPRPASDDASQDINAIEDIFEAARDGQSPGMDIAVRAGTQIVSRLHDIGLSNYLSAIRSHHSRTYTHCLTVTAVAAAFGILLGFGRKDTERLAVAGLLHDIGKSQIPLSILEKPVALDEQENTIMRTHVTLGYDMLRSMQGLPEDTLDLVLHHHEYLDGSGYPHGLRDAEISDLTRMITIADVYGALIEPRSYKPPMSGLQALEVLRAMGSKLDSTLVRVFAPLAHSLAA